MIRGFPVAGLKEPSWCWVSVRTAGPGCFGILFSPLWKRIVKLRPWGPHDWSHTKERRPCWRHLKRQQTCSWKTLGTGRQRTSVKTYTASGLKGVEAMWELRLVSIDEKYPSKWHKKIKYSAKQMFAVQEGCSDSRLGCADVVKQLSCWERCEVRQKRAALGRTLKVCWLGVFASLAHLVFLNVSRP